MPRITPAEIGSGTEAAAVARLILDQRHADTIGGDIPLLFRVLLRRPGFARAFLEMGTELRQRGSLAPATRELVIMRTAAVLRLGHVWNAHVPHAERAGIGAARLALLADPAGADFTMSERALLGYIEQACTRVYVDGPTFEAVRTSFSEDEILEITELVAFYNLVARLVGPLAVEDDDGRERHLQPFDDPLQP